VLSAKNVLADGPTLRPNGPRYGLSAVVTRTVHACAKSVSVSNFLQDLLGKSAGLTREPTCNRSRPPLYIDEGLRPIEPHTFDLMNSTYRFTLCIRSSSSLELV
jgi:hypothetical protein